MNTERLLGIDYGTKRIGLAISDETKTLAFPKEIILNDSSKFTKIGEVIKNENISEIVVGESVNFKGEVNLISIEIENFIKELQKNFSLPVFKQKEFLTSVEARKSKNGGVKTNLSQAHSKLKNKRVNKVDASAAALILQRYLDRINR